MKAEAVTALVSGMKQGGIDLVASVPSNGVTDLICAVRDDPYFTHAPLANENDALNVCIGAYLGGRHPALIAENTGVILAAYPLVTSLYLLGGVPILIIADHQGDYGGPGSHRAFGCGTQLPRMLDSFQIYHRTVYKIDTITEEVTRAAKTAQALRRPAAILISGEEVHAS